MNKRIKKKYEKKKVSLQEAWDIIAEYVAKEGSGGHSFFISSVDKYPYVTLSDAYMITRLKSTHTVDHLKEIDRT